MYKLKATNFNQEVLSDETLNWIEKNNLWNLWVPKTHGGLEMSFCKGLEQLRALSEIDGSLGWTVTLCSGANFFFGNLRKDVVDEIFINPGKPVCFGGSGGVDGIAEEKEEGYLISGRWKYATGAPYLSHFTFNAKILSEGKEVLDKEGSPVIKSFLLPKEEVDIIADWDAMGLKATVTHSFAINSKWLHQRFGFTYNEVHHHHPIYKIHFSIFADLTLLVNYIGMASHFLKEAQKVFDYHILMGQLQSIVKQANDTCKQYALNIEREIALGNRLPPYWVKEVHTQAINIVKELSIGIIKLYPILGMKACNSNHPLNHIFRDYFTATQHHNFNMKQDE